MPDPSDPGRITIGVAVQSASGYQAATEPDREIAFARLVEAILAAGPMVHQPVHESVTFAPRGCGQRLEIGIDLLNCPDFKFVPHHRR